MQFRINASLRAVMLCGVVAPMFSLVLSGCGGQETDKKVVAPTQQQTDANKNMEDFMNKQSKKGAS